MAETVTPEFTTLCNATSSASGVICVLNAILFTVIMFSKHLSIDDHDSDYKLSIPVILVTQYIGVILGTITPLCRCFAPLYLKVSEEEMIQYYLNVFKKVDEYWTDKLYDRRPSVALGCRKVRVVISMLKYLIFSVCIWLQMTIVVACKMVALIPNLFIICLLFCFHRWKSSKGSTQHHETKILNKYVLQFEEDKGDTERSLKQILKPLNNVIQKAGKRQPENLMELLAISTSFEEIERLYSHDVQPLTVRGCPECWRLSLVTLTAIASSLSDMHIIKAKNLLWSVRKGLKYIKLVEERLNAANEYVVIQNAAKKLWGEVLFFDRWLGYKVKDLASSLVMNRTRQILEWFKNESYNIVTNEEHVVVEDRNKYYRLICADSMYRFTERILLSYREETELGSQEALFDLLSSLISQILAACLSNLPRVIALKCHTNMTQERKASVHAAAQLLGKTTGIINNVQDRRFPDLNEDELAFIECWIMSYINKSRL